MGRTGGQWKEGEGRLLRAPDEKISPHAKPSMSQPTSRDFCVFGVGMEELRWVLKGGR